MVSFIGGYMGETLRNRSTLTLKTLEKELPGPTQHAADFPLRVARFRDTQDILNVRQIDILGACADVNQSNHSSILARLHESMEGPRIAARDACAIKYI